MRDKCLIKRVSSRHKGHRDANSYFEIKGHLLSCLDVTFCCETEMGKQWPQDSLFRVRRGVGRWASSLKMKVEVKSLHTLLFTTFWDLSGSLAQWRIRNFVRVQYLCSFPIFATCLPSGCAAAGNGSETCESVSEVCQERWQAEQVLKVSDRWRQPLKCQIWTPGILSKLSRQRELNQQAWGWAGPSSKQCEVPCGAPQQPLQC